MQTFERDAAKVCSPPFVAEHKEFSSGLPKAANIIGMNTFYDIIGMGDTAAAAGNPLTYNWVQVRGCIALFGRACGGFDQCPLTSFEARFPENFDSLDTVDQDAFPSKHAYGLARAQIIQLLIQLDLKTNPWNKLYGLIRKTNCSSKILPGLSGLRTPAFEEGKTPAEIQANWVWRLAAEAEGGSRRIRLRRAVVLFDSLFDLPEIADSGLLPPSRIGVPPSPDRYGRADLPPRLMSYQVAFESTSQIRRNSALSQLWRAITAVGRLSLPDDPSAQDLIDIWQTIRALPGSLIGVSDATWQGIYLASRKALDPHSSRPASETLPAHFEALVEADPDRWALKALWRQMLASEVDAPESAAPHDLLELETWRSLWCDKPEDISAATFAPYEIRARKILLRHTPTQVDPRRHVTRAWSALPKQVKADVILIKKAAERAFLRPSEVTPEWLSGLGLSADQLTQVNAALATAARAAKAPPSPRPSPAKTAWRKLRKIAQKQGVSTLGIGKVETQAIQDDRLPVTIDRNWAIETSESFSYLSQRAKFQMALRTLDRMLDEPLLAPLLYPEKFGSMPDRRKRGALDMPDTVARELENLNKSQGHSESACRGARATVRKLVTAAAEKGVPTDTLEGLLRRAEELTLDDRTFKIARRLRKRAGIFK